MNERGFMYPINLCVLLIFTVFLTIQLNQYVTDKHLLKEVTINERKHYYFLCSMRGLEERMSEEEFELTGLFQYEGGAVQYYIESYSEEMYKITYYLDLGLDKKVVSVSYYDKTLKKMVKWAEKS
ncbi:competence type IV pilus minor pilin ComGG (plasmid) [Bacillus sp. 31A1R]|uniref:Competence type IV pilus minor pilin ComGG n=1 Tax=Robertmurraya mangrovi TaxID=3098077 RepID=A0ABU5IV50_9BACI|nr:competence type IV pilus minor pilin ComGG [Bacillus sp. 31A1R]MDZ5471022.1 competence type IV pilus minor pilin ComGG [Bacillus sp. 31A1R]